MTRILNQVYSCQGSARVAAKYLQCFGYNAVPKFLKNQWKIVIYNEIRQ